MLVFIVIPGISLAIVIPIAEYVEEKWGQCVNVRIAAWMNSVSMARRGGGKSDQLARNAKMLLCRGSKTLHFRRARRLVINSLITFGIVLLFCLVNHGPAALIPVRLN